MVFENSLRMFWLSISASTFWTSLQYFAISFKRRLQLDTVLFIKNREERKTYLQNSINENLKYPTILLRKLDFILSFLEAHQA